MSRNWVGLAFVVACVGCSTSGRNGDGGQDGKRDIGVGSGTGGSTGDGDAALEAVTDVDGATEAIDSPSGRDVDAQDAEGDAGFETRGDDGPVDGDAAGANLLTVCDGLQVQPGETCAPGNDVCTADCRTECPLECLEAIIQPTPTSNPCVDLSQPDRNDCMRALLCMASRYASCLFEIGPSGGGGFFCYCASASCPNGGDGACAKQIEAVAKTSDPAAIQAQLDDPSTVLGSLVPLLRRFGSGACLIGCNAVADGGPGQ